MRLLLLAAETPPAAAEGGATYMIGVAAVFMIVAIGLFFLEILIPSFGLITLLGVGCVVAALMAAFGVGTAVGVGFIVATVVILPVFIYLVIRLAKRTPLVLGPEDVVGARETGGAAGEAEGKLEPGARGVAVSLLRPSGTASFDGRKVSVVTTGQMVEAGEQIEIISVEGTRTVVRPTRT